MSLNEPQIPTDFPASITAGTSFKVDRQFEDYPSSQWNYSLLLAGAYTLNKAATADPGGVLWHIVLTPSDTQPLNPGGGVSLAYTYVERLTASDSSGEVWDVNTGRIMVEPNLGIAQAGDAVSFEEKTLQVIELALQGRLTSDIEHYSIAGRSVSKIPVRELIELRGLYKRLAWKQRNPGAFTQPVDVVFPTNVIGPVPYTRRFTS